MKSEPSEFSWDNLSQLPDQTSSWEGVRNPQARNNMRAMKIDDEAFFYHSNCKTPMIVGIVKVVRTAYPDHSAFDKKSKYYDASSTPENPKWWMVDVKKVREMTPVSLETIKRAAAGGSDAKPGEYCRTHTKRLSTYSVLVCRADSSVTLLLKVLPNRRSACLCLVQIQMMSPPT
ncbi:PUA-like domain-containing protein [Dunaliella salina]|uniref:PUA-like domain-containing protein n=1 Tax=Dunaliella salina TaxID=3046 RepID=A0ABQ7GWE0_DUNSA|nr:PUA-like domain-containing protein [Dunaliella salina]|eukprot:KAF5838929.1 PUA-like domain-containing protein [Dunaliella salina]